MIRVGRWWVVLMFSVVAVVGGSRRAQADDEPIDATVSRAKALYMSAAYEEALAATAGLDSREAQQYRALCLMALGRTDDAQQAIDALVLSSPMFVASEAETPPRFVALLHESRSRLLPGIMRDVFAEAREQFQAKRYDGATEHFRQVLALAADPLVADAQGTEDLRLLASSFIDLAKAVETAPATAAPELPARGTPAPDALARSDAFAPAPGAASGPRASAIAVEPALTEAVPINQVIPPWPTAAGALSRDKVGAIRIMIGTDGRVTSAAIETTLHPLFDRELLDATSSWLYAPAMFRGHPVEMEKVIEIRVAPR